MRTLRPPSSCPQAADLDLFSAPASVSITHVRWGLNRRNELQSSVAHTDYADDSAWHNAEPALTDNDGADEDVEDAAAEEREHEGGIACHLLGNLELEESSSKTEYDQVYTEDDVREVVEGEQLRDTTEDHEYGHGEIHHAKDV